MEFFDFLRKHGAPPEPADELLYEFVAAELANDAVKQGLWTKALSDCSWDESKAKALYVKMRVQQLRAQLQKEIVRQQQVLSDPTAEGRAFGLSDEEIEYLRRPLKAVHYVDRYGVTRDALAQAISVGKIRGVLCREVLWVEDRKFS